MDMQTLDVAGGGVLLGGQPSPDELRWAASAGLRTVVNLREACEDAGFDECALVTSLGMEYWNLGFKDPDTLTDDVFDRCRLLMVDRSKVPLLLHCASANRVGAVWLAHRVLDCEVPYDDALLDAVEVGLRTAAYAERARAYTERRMSLCR